MPRLYVENFISLSAIMAILALSSDPRESEVKKFSDQLEPQLAQLLHAARDLVPGFQPHLFLFGLAQDHALRGSRKNDVSRLQCNEFCEVADHLPGVEDEIG